MNWFASLFNLTPKTSEAGTRIEAAMSGIADTLEHVDRGLKQQFGLAAPEALTGGESPAIEKKGRKG